MTTKTGSVVGGIHVATGRLIIVMMRGDGGRVGWIMMNGLLTTAAGSFHWRRTEREEREGREVGGGEKRMQVIQ